MTMKFILLINNKMPTADSILIFIRRIHFMLSLAELSKKKKYDLGNRCWHNIMRPYKSFVEKKTVF